MSSGREKIGGFLIRIGAITLEQKEEILNKQKEFPNKKFGQLAIEMGYINKDAIDKYLASK